VVNEFSEFSSWLLEAASGSINTKNGEIEISKEYLIKGNLMGSIFGKISYIEHLNLYLARSIDN